MIYKNKKISNGVKYPNFREEKKLWRKGYKRVVGLDEAGRGPLAGPVVAAAVMFKNLKATLRGVRFASRKIKNLKLHDSKKLSSKAREKFYKILTTYSGVEWGIGRVSEKVIDRINILEATKLAMRRAIKNLEKRMGKKAKESVWQKSHDRRNFGQVKFLIIDGNFAISSEIPQKSIIKADEKVFSCAAASIIAKITRDKMMLKYHKKYPQYGFAQHKGYPTSLHRKVLEKYGPCKIHRKSFRGVGFCSNPTPQASE